MATRAERVKEALDHIHGHEKVAFALAINDVALRRDYFNAVCGYDETHVVKTLAKLANDGVVGETQGLLFKIASPEIAKDVLSYMPEDVGLELHGKSLEWAEEKTDLSERFTVDHLIGAGEFKLAADKSLENRRAEEDPMRAKTWLKPMRLALDGLLAQENKDIETLLEVGLNVVKDGWGLLKPKTVTTILNSLMELDLNAEQLARVATCESWIKEERARARAAAKAKAKAEAEAAKSEAAPEQPQVAHETQEAK